MEHCLSGLAQNFRTPIVSNDQASLERNDFGIKGLRNGKEKLVAEVTVLGLFLINAKIFH